MAKLVTQCDFSEYSPLIGVFATPPITIRREWGALEYLTSLNKNSSGAKVLTPFDLSSYSLLINRAGTIPTVSDMRGTTVLGAQREWGALEYNSAIASHTSPKLVTPFDIVGYAPLVNYQKPTTSTFLPTTSDMRGVEAAINARTGRNTTLYFPTLTDMRDTEEIDGFREMGALEYDDTLAIANEFATTTEVAEAVWGYAISSLKGFDYIEKTGGYLASQGAWSGVANGGSSTTITLDGAASSSDDIYNNNTVSILSGVGAGQTRTIQDYVGSTRVITVSSAWVTPPDDTSVFIIRSSGGAPSAAENADAVWDELTAAHTVSGSFGKKLLSIAKYIGLK